jgi:hypothetical protein
MISYSGVDFAALASTLSLLEDGICSFWGHSWWQIFSVLPQGCHSLAGSVSSLKVLTLYISSACPRKRVPFRVRCNTENPPQTDSMSVLHY